MIGKDSLDFILQSVFRQEPLTDAEFEELTLVLMRSETTFSTRSTAKLYLLGAVMPGVTVGFYADREPANYILEKLRTEGLGNVDLLPPDADGPAQKQFFLRMENGLVKVALLPESLGSAQLLAEALQKLDGARGFNFAFVDLSTFTDAEQATRAIGQLSSVLGVAPSAFWFSAQAPSALNADAVAATVLRVPTPAVTRPAPIVSTPKTTPGVARADGAQTAVRTPPSKPAAIQVPGVTAEEHAELFKPLAPPAAQPESEDGLKTTLREPLSPDQLALLQQLDGLGGAGASSGASDSSESDLLSAVNVALGSGEPPELGPFGAADHGDPTLAHEQQMAGLLDDDHGASTATDSLFAGFETQAAAGESLLSETPSGGLLATAPASGLATGSSLDFASADSTGAGLLDLIAPDETSADDLFLAATDIPAAAPSAPAGLATGSSLDFATLEPPKADLGLATGSSLGFGQTEPAALPDLGLATGSSLGFESFDTPIAPIATADEPHADLSLDDIVLPGLEDSGASSALATGSSLDFESLTPSKVLPAAPPAPTPAPAPAAAPLPKPPVQRVPGEALADDDMLPPLEDLLPADAAPDELGKLFGGEAVRAPTLEDTEELPEDLRAALMGDDEVEIGGSFTPSDSGSFRAESDFLQEAESAHAVLAKVKKFKITASDDINVDDSAYNVDGALAAAPGSDENEPDEHASERAEAELDALDDLLGKRSTPPPAAPTPDARDTRRLTASLLELEEGEEEGDAPRVPAPAAPPRAAAAPKPPPGPVPGELGLDLGDLGDLGAELAAATAGGSPAAEDELAPIVEDETPWDMGSILGPAKQVIEEEPEMDASLGELSDELGGEVAPAAVEQADVSDSASPEDFARLASVITAIISDGREAPPLAPAALQPLPPAAEAPASDDQIEQSIKDLLVEELTAPEPVSAPEALDEALLASLTFDEPAEPAAAPPDVTSPFQEPAAFQPSAEAPELASLTFEESFELPLELVEESTPETAESAAAPALTEPVSHQDVTDGLEALSAMLPDMKGQPPAPAAPEGPDVDELMRDLSAPTAEPSAEESLLADLEDELLPPGAPPAAAMPALDGGLDDLFQIDLGALPPMPAEDGLPALPEEPAADAPPAPGAVTLEMDAMPGLILSEGPSEDWEDPLAGFGAAKPVAPPPPQPPRPPAASSAASPEPVFEAPFAPEELSFAPEPPSPAPRTAARAAAAAPAAEPSLDDLFLTPDLDIDTILGPEDSEPQPAPAQAAAGQANAGWTDATISGAFELPIVSPESGAAESDISLPGVGDDLFLAAPGARKAPDFSDAAGGAAPDGPATGAAAKPGGELDFLFDESELPPLDDSELGELPPLPREGAGATDWEAADDELPPARHASSDSKALEAPMAPRGLESFDDFDEPTESRKVAPRERSSPTPLDDIFGAPSLDDFDLEESAPQAPAARPGAAPAPAAPSAATTALPGLQGLLDDIEDDLRLTPAPADSHPAPTAASRPPEPLEPEESFDVSEVPAAIPATDVDELDDLLGAMEQPVARAPFEAIGDLEPLEDNIQPVSPPEAQAPQPQAPAQPAVSSSQLADLLGELDFEPTVAVGERPPAPQPAPAAQAPAAPVAPAHDPLAGMLDELDSFPSTGPIAAAPAPPPAPTPKEQPAPRKETVAPAYSPFDELDDVLGQPPSAAAHAAASSTLDDDFFPDDESEDDLLRELSAPSPAPPAHTPAASALEPEAGPPVTASASLEDELDWGAPPATAPKPAAVIDDFDWDEVPSVGAPIHRTDPVPEPAVPTPAPQAAAPAATPLPEPPPAATLPPPAAAPEPSLPPVRAKAARPPAAPPPPPAAPEMAAADLDRLSGRRHDFAGIHHELRAMWDNPDSSMDPLLGLAPKMAELAPNDRSHQFIAGVLAQFQQHQSRAILFYEKTIALCDADGDETSATFVLERLREIVPGDPGVCQRLADAYVRHDRHAEACALWRDQGQRFLEQNSLTQAIAAFDRAHRIAPDDVDALLGLASAYRADYNDLKAIEVVNEALQRNPASYRLNVSKGISLARLGRSRAAESCLQRALDLTWSDAGGLTWCMAELGTAGLGIFQSRCRARVLELDPQGGPALLAGGRDESEPGSWSPAWQHPGPAAIAPEPAPTVPAAAQQPMPQGPNTAYLSGLRGQVPRFSKKLESLEFMEREVSAGSAGDGRLAELLKGYLAAAELFVGDRPEDAMELYRRGETYVPHLRDKVVQAMWSEEYQRKLSRLRQRVN
ncbi:MAG: hypothetical protein HY816_16750 [Candidatus Wallbacteria bacterium]|nr:hypothetical protein [Candidatus Wallbacteria bacterium]